jgi:uncharacterized phage-associated protein
MLIDRTRQKLINAVIFFAGNTLHCGKTKLIKLLFLLDFEHFRLTGRSVTELDYYAWGKGPVPVDLYYELDEPDDDLKAIVRYKIEPMWDCQLNAISPAQGFDPSPFTKRELQLMEEISAKYHEHYATEMVDVTHAENGAWDKVWQNGEGKNCLIPYELSLDEADRESILERVAEHQEIVKNY